MAIITVALLDSELPSDANDTAGKETQAVAEASSFVNTWTSRHYDPWDEAYLDIASPSLYIIPAPAAIQRVCLEVSKAFYWMSMGQVLRDGLENDRWDTWLNRQKELLMNINVSPEWKTQTIAFSTLYTMVIGERSASGFWPRIIPQTAQVISGTGKTWLPPDDWYIRQGGEYSDQYPDAWYLFGSTLVEGTLRYMRTYRNDSYDYMRYARA